MKVLSLQEIEAIHKLRFKLSAVEIARACQLSRQRVTDILKLMPGGLIQNKSWDAIKALLESENIKIESSDGIRAAPISGLECLCCKLGDFERRWLTDYLALPVDVRELAHNKIKEIILEIKDSAGALSAPARSLSA